MPEWFFDWSNWAYGLFGVLVVVFGWMKLKPKTKNTIINGDHNRQEGGQGNTENQITDGSHNEQKG